MKLLKLILISLVVGVGTRLLVNREAFAREAAVAAHKEHGQSQSPINLNDAYEIDLRDIEFHYTTHKFGIINTGYFIRLNPKNGADEASFMVVDGEYYKLIEFHFHTPSEHLIEGKSYAMEAHFVHTAKDGGIAVIGILFENGAYNKEFEKIIRTLPDAINVETIIDAPLALHALFPKDKRAYRYLGSLTTPAYLEGVKWFVMKNPVQLSDDQIKKMSSIMGKNDRPVQPRNQRPVFLACC